MKRIVVGLSPIDAENRWVGGRYYLHHLVRAVSSLPENERVDFVDVWWQRVDVFDPFEEVRPLLAGQRVITPPTSFPSRLKRRARRAIHRWRDARDLFYDAGIDALFPIAPCDTPGIPLVSWIADFQYARMPELFSDELRARFNKHARDNARDAAIVILSSEDGRRDFERFISEHAAKARVLHFCSIPTPEWWALDSATVQMNLELPEKFFILSNQFSDHKNHRLVFEAVRLLRDRGVNVTLVCTGSTYGFHGDSYFASLERFIAEHSLSDSIRILGLLPRDQQVALTRRSIAMLQPSRFEGWSTVVEDAKSLGKRILVSDLDVNREQSPDNATFLPLDDAGAWADAMEIVWRERIPGPHVDEEARGKAHIEIAQHEFGSGFVKIIREALGR